MTEVEGIIKRWGNSFGIIIPKDIMDEENWKVGDKVNFLAIKDNSAMKSMFGIIKGKKINAQKMKDEARRDLYND